MAEIFLALRLELELSKDEILELYLNKIFFGYRSYGIAAAAEFYYGKKLADLDLAEAATVSYTHLRAHETVLDLVCRLLLEKKTSNKIAVFDTKKDTLAAMVEVGKTPTTDRSAKSINPK